MTNTLASATEEVPFLEQYLPPRGVFDEMLDAKRRLRPKWSKFFHSLGELGEGELARRWRRAQQLLRQTGIAYTASSEQDKKPRPWTLDPIPLLVAASEWRKVADGLAQRARLFNLVLADLYGPQRLLQQGTLPPEILYLHPGFRRPYHGQRPPAKQYLSFYAADLGRSPTGDWWILADRTEAPSGAGYALENRLVLSQMLPDIVHRSRVERLAPYFIALRDRLQQLAPPQRDNPRTVLLSQGPQSANFFEDAYLARYLGYTLVEADDLAIRNNHVMLKTLSGLLPVDVVVRRPNSENCDPLELAQTTSSGVAGLLQAARERNVTVASPFGSGLVESPVFMAFMPTLCQTLLGEELLLPGVATWWCGQPESMEHVLKHIDQLIVKRAFRSRGNEMQVCQKLNTMPKEELVRTIRANPQEFVAQERVLRSSAPIWREEQLQPGHIAVRSFVVASDDSYVVMNGGLARVSMRIEPLELSILAGEGSKDVWVLADGPVKPVTLLQRAGKPLQLQRGGADLPSRVADNLFWLGRHLERADFAIRLLRAVARRLTSEVDAEAISELPLLIRALAEHGQIEPGFVVEGLSRQLPAFESHLPDAVLAQNQTGNLRSIVQQIVASASRVRDRMSLDSWSIIDRIHGHFRSRQAGVMDLGDLLVLLNGVLVDLAAFEGMTTESMTRSQAWRFHDMGRRLERAAQLVALTKCLFANPMQANDSLMEAALEIGESLMTYRSRYLATLQLSAVLDLLLTDESSPRSVVYQLELLANHVEKLPRDRTQITYSTEQRLAMSALHSIKMVDVQALAEAHGMGEKFSLLQVLETLERNLPKLSDAIAHRYLIHAGPAHQLAEIRPERPDLP